MLVWRSGKAELQRWPKIETDLFTPAEASYWKAKQPELDPWLLPVMQWIACGPLNF
jgi:hypothetical protein